MAHDAPPGTAIRPPIAPMLARRVDEIPDGSGWLYEPKWDGFRAILFVDGDRVELQSRDRRPFARYFPEIAAAVAGRFSTPLVLDGEIVIAGDAGLDFDALLMRIHPAESRVQMLAARTPASFVAFDLLAEGDTPLVDVALEERRRRLEAALAERPPRMLLTPATRDIEEARDWFQRFEGAGFDGVIAKRLDGRYEPGERVWLKIKHLRTVDCVVGGLRWAKGASGEAVGSLLLGLYDGAGVLHYVGHTSSFRAPDRRHLAVELRALETADEGSGFGRGRTPGGPSRWSREADRAWVRLRPELVCEVTFDQLQAQRFRHGASFVRWRPDKPPAECTFDQIAPSPPVELRQLFAAGAGDPEDTQA